MSEYQYYEFQAIDRPLGEADREALRAISTRARITATSFTNSYEWGDLKGDPAKILERWFDLHLYLANWGSRRLMMRLPRRLVDPAPLNGFLGEVDCANVRIAGENLIIDISRDEVEPGDWDDGSGWLGALAPLRADVLAGDLRMFYVLWLMAVEDDVFEEDEPEPMPGIGPLTGALQALAEFFGIDLDLVRAAAEQPAAAGSSAVSPAAAHGVIQAMSDAEKTRILSRLHDGDPHVGLELRAMVRRMATRAAPSATVRTVGDLRARAHDLAQARARAAAEKALAEQRRVAEEARKARQDRLTALRRRGEGAWREVEDEIERRNADSYDKATALLSDLKTIAEEQGAADDYRRRLAKIRQQHERKGKLIERLAALG
jgi:hypothetical protein